MPPLDFLRCCLGSLVNFYTGCLSSYFWVFGAFVFNIQWGNVSCTHLPQYMACLFILSLAQEKCEFEWSPAYSFSWIMPLASYQVDYPVSFRSLVICISHLGLWSILSLYLLKCKVCVWIHSFFHVMPIISPIISWSLSFAG